MSSYYEKPIMISIIIPCKTIDSDTERCVKDCLKQTHSNYEIIILPDYNNNATRFSSEKIRIIPTGSYKPLRKRLIGCSVAKGDLYAFIDSDAFPDPEWLSNSIVHFNKSEIAAVSGPSLTPETNDDRERASGLLQASPFCSASESIRYKQNHRSFYVEEIPTCNLVIRKTVLDSIKKLVPDIWPGEEIVLCGLIVKRLGRKIIHDPKVLVYHHRRPLFIPYLKQIWNYGLVKGYLLKSHQEYVRKLFMLPSLLILIASFGLMLGFFNPLMGIVLFFSIIAYLLIIFTGSLYISLKDREPKMMLLFFTGIILTHLIYGLAFIKGLFSLKLD